MTQAASKRCRLCKSNDLVMFLDLGVMPHAGAFIENESEIKSEKSYPLQVHYCKKCSLVQVVDAIPKEILFTNYFYLSSVTRTLSEHFREYAEEVVKGFNLSPTSLIVEIGCNDGVLLKPFTELGVRAVGVEPSVNVSKIAKDKGLEVINSFFTDEVAASIATSHGKADIIAANNVFAHIDNMDEAMRAIKVLLKDDGVFIFEVHYLLDLLEKLQYDMIYHEHLCYYSLSSLVPFFKKFGMEIFDVKRISIHAGSIRAYVRNTGKRQDLASGSVEKLVELEEKTGIRDSNTYLEFAAKVKEETKKLVDMLRKLKADGKRIVGYGASGRANTMLNYAGIGRDVLDYIVDESPSRYGRLTPGTHIPIVHPSQMRNDNPDYILMLAWSYKREIMEKEKAFLERGGKFIIPLPTVSVTPREGRQN